jgi:DNA-binding NarL/FixJ family response regulator
VIRVLIVDDHQFFRQCLAAVINSSTGLEAVGECRDGDEVVDAVQELNPHVVLMDVRMGTASGIDAVAALRRNHPHLPVIMLTSETAAATRAAARANGASGYLLKGCPTDLVGRAIHHVAAGLSAWSEEFEAALGVGA